MTHGESEHTLGQRFALVRHERLVRLEVVLERACELLAPRFAQLALPVLFLAQDPVFKPLELLLLSNVPHQVGR